MFKAGFEGALSNMILWMVSLPMATGVEPGDLSGLFQPKLLFNKISILEDCFFPTAELGYLKICYVINKLPRILLCMLQMYF